MTSCCSLTTARQDELLECRQTFIECVKIVFKTLDKTVLHGAVAGNAEFAAEFEQVVLYFSQALANFFWQAVVGEHHADAAVCLVNRAVSLYSRGVFRNPRTIAKSGSAIVSGARVNLAKSVSHAPTIGRAHWGVKARCLFLTSTAAIVAANKSVSIALGKTVTTYDPAQASEFLQVALEAAQKAATISREYYAGNFTVTTKSDMTPVTQADVECEQAISEIILRQFPDHGFFGEETGKTQADADYLWLVDPIDGTKGFVRQYPFFSTQIALMHRGEIIVGVSSGTMMNELAWAEKGQGAWLNGKRLTVSDIDDRDRVSVSTGNLKSLAAGAGWQALGDIVARTDRIRGYGDYYHYHLLAAGKIEAVIESDVNILDIAALSLIVTEAGGVFTNLNGEQPDLEIRSVLAANPSLHAKYLQDLKGFVT